MKLFKSTLAIVALFAIGSMDAKALRRTGATTATSTRSAQRNMPVLPPLPVDPEQLKKEIIKEIADFSMSIADANFKAVDSIIERITASTLSPENKRELQSLAIEMQNALIRGIDLNKNRISTMKLPVKEVKLF